MLDRSPAAGLSGIKRIRERLQWLIGYCVIHGDARRLVSLLKASGVKKTEQVRSPNFEAELSRYSPARHEESLPPALAEIAARLAAQEPQPEDENFVTFLRATTPTTNTTGESLTRALSRATQWFHVRIHWIKVHRPSGLRLRKTWANQRGDIYLAIAAILLPLVLWNWRTSTLFGDKNSPQLKSNARQNRALDQSRPVPEDSRALPNGDPDARVWVDFRTAKYYCADSRRYGKTKDGEFTTQWNARLSQYDPANHKPCN